MNIKVAASATVAMFSIALGSLMAVGCSGGTEQKQGNVEDPPCGDPGFADPPPVDPPADPPPVPQEETESAEDGLLPNLACVGGQAQAALTATGLVVGVAALIPACATPPTCLLDIAGVAAALAGYVDAINTITSQCPQYLKTPHCVNATVIASQLSGPIVAAQALYAAQCGGDGGLSEDCTNLYARITEYQNKQTQLSSACP